MKKHLLPALVLVLMLVTVCACTTETASNGDKITFTLTVTHSDGTSKDFEIDTTETNLRKALDSESLISGTESATGLFVTTVDGETANYDENESWWSLSKNGEATMTGVDGCFVTDGDKYCFEYKIGF